MDPRVKPEGDSRGVLILIIVMPGLDPGIHAGQGPRCKASVLLGLVTAAFALTRTRHLLDLPRQLAQIFQHDDLAAGIGVHQLMRPGDVIGHVEGMATDGEHGQDI